METTAFSAQEACEGFAAANWGDFLFLEWRQAITLENLRRFETFVERVPADAGRGAYRGIMVLVYDVSAVPSSEVREAMAVSMKKRSHLTRSIAMVYEAEGLRATVLRSMSAAITLMSRQPAPTRVFANVADAAAWQARQHGDEQLAPTLRQNMDQVRRLGTVTEFRKISG